MKELLINGEILFVSNVVQLFILTLLITAVSKINFSNTQRILYATIQSLIVVILKLLLPKELTIITMVTSIIASILSAIIFLKINLKKSKVK